MAEKARDAAADLNGEEPMEDGGTMTNARNRAKLIRSKKRDIDRLTGDIDSINETKKQLSKSRGDAYRDMKTKLGFTRVDCEMAFRMIDLEEAIRDKSLDTFREIYEALGVGEQMDMFKATDAYGKDSVAAHRERKTSEPTHEGSATSQ